MLSALAQSVRVLRICTEGKSRAYRTAFKRAREAGGNTDLSLELEYVNGIACGEFARIESVGRHAHKESIKIVSGEARSTESARRKPVY